MAPTSLTALLHSPTPSSADDTYGHGRTLPDVSLGSLGSSFRSEDQEGRGPARTPVAKAPRLAPIYSSETSTSASLHTPSSSHPATALVSLSPPPTLRRPSSQSVLPDMAPGTNAPRRSRYLRRNSASSASSSGSANEAATGYNETNGILESMSLNTSSKINGRAAMAASRGAGPSKRNGRHSVAADVSQTGPMTLRDQEQQLNAAKKDIFNLQLENHFLKERLANMAPDHIEAALKENVKLKLEILNLSKEMKKVKKLLVQQDKDLGEAARDRQGSRAKERDADLQELEALYQAERERRKAAEKELDEGGDVRGQLDDVEASERIWRDRAEQLEEEVERLRDTADRAEEELEQVKAGLGGSVGLGKGRESRTIAKLEHERDELQKEVDLLRRGGMGDPDEMEERLNELQDRLAAAQLDMDRRDAEIEQLNDELDAKVRDHDKVIEQVENEWRDEVLEARAQVDELKDALEAREHDTKDIREALMEREEELALANEKVAELEGVQAETHDRLEETLKNIERDNAEKEGDLVAANREVEELGQRVYDLEEACEDLKARETELSNDLASADEAFEQSKKHYENLVNALKEARRKLQDERDGAIAEARDMEHRRIGERDAGRKERKDEIEKLQRALSEREQVNGRLQKELEAARVRVSQRDRDLDNIQGTLKSLESERRKLGDDRTSDRHGLNPEIDRVKRDLIATENDLDRARDEVDQAEERLRQRDVELSAMLDKQRELESRLASERQGRLNMSDKLDMANKHARQYEREADTLRARLEELEPMLSETQHERLQVQKQSEQQRQERSELLLRVFKDINRFLGTEDQVTPANFGAFRDSLVSKLRAMIHVRTDFEKRIRDTETSLEQRVSSLKKQLDQKWRAVDSFEASVKKLELTKLQWKSKYSIKEGELEASKARNAELSQQVSSYRKGSSSSDSTLVKSLTERAQAAEKRATNSTNQLAMLEAKVGELQSRAGQAEDKWEARVKEYEHRLRIAGEKIKTEKQGGKERARQLEDQVRDLERQVDQARRRNNRAEGVVATAQHLLPPGDSL